MNAKTKRAVNETVTIQVTMTKPMVEMLESVVKTGFYGNNKAAASERLIAEALRSVLKEGMIQKRAKVMES